MFENLPVEMILEICKQSSRQTQASLAQVNKTCNTVANDKSLKLFKYKAENLVYQVGNVRLVVKKIDENKYNLLTTYNGQKVSNSGMGIQQKSFDTLVEKAKEGTSSLIEELKTMGPTARISASALELEQSRITSNDSLELFRCKPENLVLQIGDTSLIIEKISEDLYALSTIPNGQIASMLRIEGMKQKSFDKLVEKAKEGASSLIEELKTMGPCKQVSILEKAQQEEQQKLLECRSTFKK